VTGTILKAHRVEGLARSAATAPLSAEQVTELLASHHQLAKDWAEVEALLRRLAPAWVEMRTILNDLNRVLGSDRRKHLD
jgi:hypothetical protein